MHMQIYTCFFIIFLLSTSLVAKPLYELAILLILCGMVLAFSRQQAKLLVLLLVTKNRTNSNDCVGTYRVAWGRVVLQIGRPQPAPRFDMKASNCAEGGGHRRHGQQKRRAAIAARTEPMGYRGFWLENGHGPVVGVCGVTGPAASSLVGSASAPSPVFFPYVTQMNRDGPLYISFPLPIAALDGPGHAIQHPRPR
jgi:hypothetical protein